MKRSRASRHICYLPEIMEKLFIASLIKIFERDLNKLETEINLYNNESGLWQIRGEVKNSGANLCLHLCGNLQHYIGHVLGKIHYIRNRDDEFSARNVAQQKILEEIQRTKISVINTLKNLDSQVLQANYPEEVLGYSMTTLYFLIHLQGHLNYHLGQINYHRRLINF